MQTEYLHLISYVDIPFARWHVLGMIHWHGRAAICMYALFKFWQTICAGKIPYIRLVSRLSLFYASWWNTKQFVYFEKIKSGCYCHYVPITPLKSSLDHGVSLDVSAACSEGKVREASCASSKPWFGSSNPLSHVSALAHGHLQELNSRPLTLPLLGLASLIVSRMRRWMRNDDYAAWLIDFFLSSSHLM